MRRPPTIYLAGPINGCSDDECNDWRQFLISALPECAFLDPMRRDYRGREDESVNEIVQGDKQDIDNADIVVAHCWQVSWGTAMEIFYAHQYAGDGMATPDRGMRPRKKIVLIIPEGQRISPWLRKHSDLIVPTVEDAAASVRDLADEFMDGYPMSVGFSK